MIYRILKEQVSRNLFEEINKQPNCEQCRNRRSDYSKYDKKYNDNYSIILGSGFTSGTLLPHAVQKTARKEVKQND
jgi:hypothetical protein